MPEHKALTRTFLIFFIINFALAAPVAVRGRQERRRGSLEEGSTNVPGPASSPDWTDILSQSPYADISPPTPTPDRALLPIPELTEILSPSPYADNPPLTPPPSYALSPSSDWVHILYSNSPPPSPSPSLGWAHILNSNSPPLSPSPSSDWAEMLSHTRIQHPDSPPPTQDNPALPPPPHPSQPGPSEDHLPSPSGFSGTLSGTGGQPTLPQSPGLDPELHSLLIPEDIPSDFWDAILRGKFKRRISGSDAMNLAQRNSRSRIF